MRLMGVFSVVLFSPLLIVLLSSAVSGMGAVLEMGAEFLTKKNQGMWFVKFYAPWCGYCKKLEPVWNDLEKRVRPLGVTVAKIDATVHESVASIFEVRGFPTLIFFKGDKKFTYSGSRSVDSLEEFVKRVSGPPVEEISTVAQFVQLRHMEKPFFLYYGDQQALTPLYEAYRTAADMLQEKTYFKMLQKIEFLPNDMKLDEAFLKDSIAVVKGASFWKYDNSTALLICKKPESSEECVESLTAWMRRERLPNFVQISLDNFHDFQNNGGNKLAIAVVPDETAHSGYILEWVKNIANNFRSSYASSFSFGFIKDPHLFVDITLDSTVQFPTVFVLDPPTDHYFLPEQQSSELTQGNIMQFLDQVKSGETEPKGGSSFLRKFRRAFHELSKALYDLFSVSFILAMLVLAVPLVVVSCLCYLLCTMDTTEDTSSEVDEDDEDLLRASGSLEEGRGQSEFDASAQYEGLRQRPTNTNASSEDI